MKKYLLLAVCAPLVFTVWYYWKNPPIAKVKIRDNIITLELAVTPEEKAKGLSGRTSLPPDQGMLFIYDHKELYGFWMKDMKFALDFLWIADQKIVDITEYVPAPKEGEAPVQLAPKVPVDKILEVNAATADRLGILPGDDVTFLTN